MWALLHSIERIVFTWLELGLAGLGALGAGVTFDSTDLFGHRMLPQLIGLKWKPEQVLLWEGRRTLGVCIASFSNSSLLTSLIVLCTSAFFFEKDYMNLFVIPTASNIWTLLLLLAGFFSIHMSFDNGNKNGTINYETPQFAFTVHAPIGLMAQLDWKFFKQTP